MGYDKPSAKALRAANKLKRKELFILYKKAKGKERREERFRRKKEEDRDPSLRTARLAKNNAITLDDKRLWDNTGGDDSLGSRVDLDKLRQRRIEQAPPVSEGNGTNDNNDDEYDSILDTDDEDGSHGDGDADSVAHRANSLAPSSTSTNLDLARSSLILKFPMLFSNLPVPNPKILITTSLNSNIHDDAQLLSTLFPNSNYIPRSAHRYGHKYSIREICKFAANRDYKALVLVKEDLKRPTGLSIVHLPSGPTFHFTISNWIQGKKLPGHGNPTNHYPELLLNNFKTPLGFLTARLFQTLFPPRPEFQGRQVVTLHNQRDYIFVRRHRYVFREKRATEKSIVGTDGREIKGVEGIRAGLQELGPRFTLKLRRLDKGIGRAGSEGKDAVQWEWKAKMEKDRKVFNL